MLNLTPHAIKIRRPDGTEIEIPPSGTVARVTTVETVVGEQLGVPVVRRVFGAPINLPPEGTPCLVASITAAAVPGRAGVYTPDTGPTAIRDSAGNIVAVTRLIAA